MEKAAETYLRHVDGLRAVAVLSVILYHFGIPHVPGGYVGVDVFFVISGFLITRLIYDELTQTGRFDFARFYIRRIRRLFPALSVTLGLSFCVALVILSPRAFDQFGKSLTASVLSVSNILFWSQSGYFDADSHLKPLLHTWSLSVEEQFYMFWPAMLWLLIGRLRLQRRGIAVALALAGALSFAANYVWVVGKFDANFRYSIFFLTPFRVFEFVIGGFAIFLLAPLRNRRVLQEVMMAAGLAAIGYAVATYNETLVFPYWYALLPSVGSLLVIVSGQSALAGRLLTNRAAVATGLISYSLYLVHWPIIVFFRYLNIALPNMQQLLLLLVATFAAAILLYRFVETPMRRNAPGRTRRAPQKAFVIGSLVSMFAVAGLGAIVAAQDGWSWRQPQALNTKQIETGRARRFTLISTTGCNLQTLANGSRCDMDRPWQVLVFGNSHEPDGYNAFAAAYGGNPAVNLISFGTLNNCDAVMDHGRPVSKVGWGDCAMRVAKLSDPAFVAKLNAVVYSANQPFAGNKQFMWDTLAGLQHINPKLAVVALGGYLNTSLDCAELYNRTYSFEFCKDPQVVTFKPFGERDKPRIAIPADLRYLYIDKAAMLCPSGDLPSCLIEAEGEPYSYDQHHLSFGFANLVGRRMVEWYGADLEKLGFPGLARHAADRG